MVPKTTYNLEEKNTSYAHKKRFGNTTCLRSPNRLRAEAGGQIISKQKKIIVFYTSLLNFYYYLCPCETGRLPTPERQPIERRAVCISERCVC